MSGICGFYDLDRKTRRGELQRIARGMGDSIAHRGPDGSGIWNDPDVPLVLAHRRLATLDLSAAGAQPMASASGRYHITLDGAIYNNLSLRRELETEDARFRSRSDTETVLAAFDLWGINRTLQRLNGSFAFAVWDREKRQLHLARDRLGEKPLYIGWAGNNFVFASEIKAFRAHPGFRPVIDRNSLTLYMRFGCVPAPHSIFSGVWQLPPGHRMTLVFDLLAAGDDLQKEWSPYWHMARVVEESCHNPLTGDDAALTDQFETLLKECVQDRMKADVPAGAFLSGGTDSSAIAALMQMQTTQRIKTFSIGFTERGYDDAAAAHAVARHLGTEHHERIVTQQDTVNILPGMAGIYDEPFAGTMSVSAALLADFTKDHVHIALSGDGGNETMGGLARHGFIPALWQRAGWWPHPLRQVIARGIHKIPAARWSQIMRNRPDFAAWIYTVADLLPLRDIDAAYIHTISHWQKPASLVRDGREPLTRLHDSAWQPRGLTAAERVLYADALLLLGNDVLVRSDRSFMASGIETRAPLLDHRMFEFCWRLPIDARIRVHGGKTTGKWLLRQVVRRHVPEHLFDRKKTEFDTPMATWLRGPLRDWAHDLLNASRLEQQGYLNPVPVGAAWQEHLSGDDRNTRRLWTVLMFQSWLEHHRGDAP